MVQVANDARVRARLRDVWTRGLLSVPLWSAVAVLGAVTAVVLAPESWSQAGSSARAAVLAAFTTVMVARTSRRHLGGHRIWSWFSAAGMVMTVAAVADLVTRLVTGTERSGPYVFPAGVLASCFLIYQGLILWNRTRTITADTGDVLNGLSATLAVAALGNLALIWLYGQDQPGPWAAVQLHLLCLGAAFVLLGTLASVTQLGSALGDPRAWVGMAAGVVALFGTVLAPSTGLVADSVTRSPRTADQYSFTIGWVLVIGVLAVCSMAPQRPVVPAPATAHEVTVGALVVLMSGVAVLLLSTRLDPDLTTTAVVLAGLAILGASTRGMHLIRDLASLAVRRQEALTDDLTGLANRRAFTQELAGGVRRGGVTSLLIIDLDDFKDINDSFGHAVGDEVLTATAGYLRQATPPGGLVARLGGDEFAVLLPHTSGADAVEVAWKLVESVQAARATVNDAGTPLAVGLSIGVARHDQAFGGEHGNLDDNELFRRADAAMYVAKTTGVQVSVYDQELDGRRRDQNQLTQDLLAAFDGSDTVDDLPFEVFYQPQVSMSTGRVAGVEALVRWKHPVRGLLAPASFLELVERHGRMRELTQFVVWSSLRDAALWERTGLGPMRVSVNLSTSCLADPVFPKVLQEIVNAGIDPSAVTFEITETTLMRDPEHSLRICAVIVDAGFGLSIDDYGTGYSSLAYLSDLPATELKIDRAFVSRIQHDVRVRAIVSGTVQLAHQLGLRIVAEGAEQACTLGLLRELGCDEVQGYVYSPPLPALELHAWVSNQMLVPVDEGVH
ncbi:bifunctional diguanylate cyclase/phosphodiesterase [Kineosporia sp. NBRC 101731]|uniref:putative bifunctional diguanylate cyclase/phosphodiesterase n=1 Tax=Kineosporia sp. NBRC 101731 TaxID=3032199 RepID=UPI0024A3725A|nr:bifunctional diguanylate cyclase/phosphodiesterase [Kineosporia sp. NBRC 101731]GLY30986.1 GGDEF-domain containing protein [Kineosporia sp. NBRC 101731]